MTTSRTSIDDLPYVTEYLRELDIALARLPRDAARELRQQIVEHLDEAIEPDCDDQHVREILERLGRPDDLVAESSGVKRRRQILRTWGWRRWTVIAAAVALVGSGAGYLVDMGTQPALQAACQPCGFYFPVDAAHEHVINDLTGDEMDAPDRPGQVQGFVFTVVNTSSWPETIVGADHPSLGSPNDPSIAVAPLTTSGNGSFASIPWRTTPVAIPPGQQWYLRMTWRSARCFIGQGGTQGSNVFSFTVKIGWFSHVQNLNLQETVGLSGVKQPACP